MANNEGTVTAGQEVVWATRASLPLITPAEGVDMRLLVGEAMMLSHVTLAPGAVVPRHQHPNEQLGYVMEGVMTLEIGGEARDLGPGACYLIPGNVPHGATSPDGCLLLDVFSPPRADYAERARAATDAGKGPSA